MKQNLQDLISQIATFIGKNEEPSSQMYAPFFQQPELAYELIDLLNHFSEDQFDEEPPFYSACLFSFDICIAQLQAAIENKNKIANKVMTNLMNHLTQAIQTNKHSLGFWLPVLNAFYEVHAELSDGLKEAYFELASQEEGPEYGEDQASHIEAMRNLILELSDLSTFEITEHFFAQSYAMPPDFFYDLIADLYQIKEGQDIALLTLLHPKPEVREVVVEALDELMNDLTLSSISLSRLETIRHWYPKEYQPMFNRWIKTQRKKEVVFATESQPKQILLKATEVDGTDAQGLFIHLRANRKNRLCGVLLKYQTGVNDSWISLPLSSSEVKEYYQQAFEENITLREIDLDYFEMLVEHFLAITLEQGLIPDIHFLEILEFMNLRLKPQKLDIHNLIEELSIQIVPFTQETITQSFKRSKTWLKNKSFTESWYIENQVVDKIVNHNSSFIEGVKVCRLEQAMEAVFSEEFEQHREQWQFHFLWTSLWFKAKAKKNEKIWQDCFLIAHAIYHDLPLKEIPVMQEICRQTVINSVETMQERKTYLSKE